MKESKGLMLRVALMCLLIVPCWVLHRELVPPPFDTGFYLNLFFFFFGPIAAGVYAGVTARTWVFAVYACVVTSVILTVLYSVIWLTDLLYFEILPITSQLFAMIFGLLLLGASPVLVAREALRRRRRSPGI
jgi:hypothetical protein